METPAPTQPTATTQIPPPQATTTTPIDPQHPSRKHRAPSAATVQSTLRRLQHDIPLIAHGVKSRARPVHVRYCSDTEVLEWQTDRARRQQQQLRHNNNNNSNNNLDNHGQRLPLANIMYIDVGKKTMALLQQTNVSDEHCFSLLTASGSLDLQASTTLERDALVSCFSLLLDQVHDRDWRLLYEETASSVAVASGGGGAAAAAAAASGPWSPASASSSPSCASL